MAGAARIFVSHAPEDSAWCGAFVQALREAGADVWDDDEHHLGDGASGEESARELRARPIFIVILSPAALASPGVQRAVSAASAFLETGRTRSMLVVMAEPADVPRLWADYPRVSGPGERGLLAPEAARRALAILATAPAPTPGTSAVSASSDPAREVDDRAAVIARLKAYRPGPPAPNRVTRWLRALAMVVVMTVGVLASLYLLPRLAPRSQICLGGGGGLDPLVGSAPAGITTGPDGALWFTESQGNRIGRITTSGQIIEFPASGAPEEITSGPDGALWFTEYGGNHIGRITTGGGVSEYPTSGASEGITAGPDGALWFTESQANQIGRITTSGEVQEFPLPTAGSFPGGITTGPDGALWFTEVRGQIGRITTSGQLREFPASGVPVGITAGPDGALWFTDYGGCQIGRITTSGQLRKFPIFSVASTPRGITTGPDGALWFTEYEGNQIGRITTNGDISEYYVTRPCDSPNNAAPRGITRGPDRALWFTEFYGNAIGRITTGGQLSDFPLPAPPPTSRIPPGPCL